VWCRDCGHQVEPDPAELSRAQTWAAVLDWRDRLVCSRCGRREIDIKTKRRWLRQSGRKLFKAVSILQGFHAALRPDAIRAAPTRASTARRVRRTAERAEPRTGRHARAWRAQSRSPPLTARETVLPAFTMLEATRAPVRNDRDQLNAGTQVGTSFAALRWNLNAQCAEDRHADIRRSRACHRASGSPD